MQEVQTIAHKVEDTLGPQIPSRFPLYCKYAWRLSPARIFTNLEAALQPNPKIRSPHSLFTWLCEQELKNS